jgi:hypothetical protein
LALIDDFQASANTARSFTTRAAIRISCATIPAGTSQVTSAAVASIGQTGIATTSSVAASTTDKTINPLSGFT